MGRMYSKGSSKGLGVGSCGKSSGSVKRKELLRQLWDYTVSFWRPLIHAVANYAPKTVTCHNLANASQMPSTEQVNSYAFGWRLPHGIISPLPEAL